MRTADASGSRVRFPVLAAVGLSLVLGVTACENGQDNGAGPVVGPGTQVTDGQLQRVDALEYDRAVQRTLGVSLSNEERLALIGHDTDITPADFQQHFARIERLLGAVFADQGLRGRILTCAPTFASDLGCTQSIVREVGARAWQRPLTETEVVQLTQVAASATALGSDFPESIQHVVKTMMISAPFLYRVQGV